VALDAARDRLVLSGGRRFDIDFTLVYDLWTLDLAGTPQWTLRVPNSFDLGIAANQGLVLDPLLDRVILLGGRTQTGFPNTIYSSPLATLPGWTNLDPDDLSPMTGGGAGFYDAAMKRGLFWNGTLWEVTWPGSAGVPPATPKHGLALASPRPNPATGEVTLEITSDRDATVTVELFDTSGRRVAPAVRRPMRAGQDAFRFTLPRGLPPGLYLVRAREGSRTSQVRLAVTR
jgi:hypothetical protein